MPDLLTPEKLAEIREQSNDDLEDGCGFEYIPALLSHVNALTERNAQMAEAIRRLAEFDYETVTAAGGGYTDWKHHKLCRYCKVAGSGIGHRIDCPMNLPIIQEIVKEAEG